MGEGLLEQAAPAPFDMPHANTKGSQPRSRGATFASFVSFISLVSSRRPDEVAGARRRNEYAIDGEAAAKVVSFVLWRLTGRAYLADLIAAYCL